MDFRAIFDSYEEKITQTSEVTKVEESVRKIYDKIAAYNAELADRVDMIIGSLARAYEVQGLNGGLAVARGTL